jgi:hypothetical protein
MFHQNIGLWKKAPAFLCNNPKCDLNDSHDLDVCKCMIKGWACRGDFVRKIEGLCGEKITDYKSAALPLSYVGV